MHDRHLDCATPKARAQGHSQALLIDERLVKSAPAAMPFKIWSSSRSRSRFTARTHRRNRSRTPGSPQAEPGYDDMLIPEDTYDHFEPVPTDDPPTFKRRQTGHRKTHNELLNCLFQMQAGPRSSHLNRTRLGCTGAFRSTGVRTTDPRSNDYSEQLVTGFPVRHPTGR